jgi:DNA (cytosine-5)-methyltransferase 1
MVFRPYGDPPSVARRRRGPVVVDLFAGSGGLALGLELAGFVPIYVNELNPAAMATYLSNRLRRHPDLVRNTSSDIAELTGGIASRGRGGRLKPWASSMRTAHGDIDLVVGGPPCQGYSAIGHRRSFAVPREDVPSNHLYRDMAAVIRALKPRMFLFENVANLERAKWTDAGSQGEIWRAVLKTFKNLDGYTVTSDKLYARDYGVPQNRPRLLIVGIRSDLGFREEMGRPGFGLLPDPQGGPPDPIDFLGDLVDPEYQPGAATVRYPKTAESVVQQWFRFDPVSQAPYRRGDIVTDHEYSRHKEKIVSKFQYMLETNGDIRTSDRTKKFAQRLIPATWGPGGPNITATSLPDDFVHFSQPRTLTVREWARLQTFPDWYQFDGVRTTGGRRRAGDPDAGDWTREVPKYTQIGNAVPVLLGQAIGEHFRELLR